MKHTYISPPSREEQESKNRLGIGRFAMLTATLCLVLWASYSLSTQGISAHGQIEMDTPAQSLQPPQPAKIAEILVSEGEIVERGQPLLLLDMHALTDDVAQVRLQIAIAKDRIALLNELIAPASKTQPYSISNETLKRAVNSAELRAQEYRGFQRNLDKIEAIRRGVSDQISATNEQITLILQELSSHEILENRGLATRSKQLALKREYAKLRVTAAELSARRRSLQHDAAALRAEHTNNRLIEQASYLEQRAQISNDLMLLRERERRLISEQSRLTIRAPMSGIVRGMIAKTVGSRVTPSDVIADIIPHDHKRKIIARVPAQIAQRLWVDQTVRIKIPKTANGSNRTLIGSVMSISPFPHKTPEGELYPIEIKPNKQIGYDQLEIINTLLPTLPLQLYFLRDTPFGIWPP